MDDTTKSQLAEYAGHLADSLIATEVAIQDKMWGAPRKDASNCQLLKAAHAQIIYLAMKLEGTDPVAASDLAKAAVYPKDWDVSAFRDYGSNIANLVVAAAFLRSEIKRRVLIGESTDRAKRSQPYETATPSMSSEQASVESRTIPHVQV